MGNRGAVKERRNSIRTTWFCGHPKNLDHFWESMPIPLWQDVASIFPYSCKKREIELWISDGNQEHEFFVLVLWVFTILNKFRNWHIAWSIIVSIWNNKQIFFIASEKSAADRIKSFFNWEKPFRDSEESDRDGRWKKKIGMSSRFDGFETQGVLRQKGLGKFVLELLLFLFQYAVSFCF